MVKIFSILAGVLLLASCATPYQSQGALGGFQETKLASDSWRVSFHSNGYTGEAKTYDYMLLRCAELGQANGFRYFTVDDENLSNRVTNQIHSGNLFSANSNAIRKPEAHVTARFYKSRPSVAGTVYECSTIAESVKAKHKIEESE
jgi:hypothetical protein